MKDQEHTLSAAAIRSEKQLRYAIMFACTIVIVLSFLMRVVGSDLVYLPGSKTALPDSCGMRLMFGLDCPACGLTRAFISISHGKFLNAWLLNPASFVVYLFVLVQIPWQIYQLANMKRGKPPITSFWIYLLPIAMAVAVALQWLARLSIQLWQ